MGCMLFILDVEHNSDRVQQTTIEIHGYAYNMQWVYSLVCDVEETRKSEEITNESQ